VSFQTTRQEHFAANYANFHKLVWKNPRNSRLNSCFLPLELGGAKMWIITSEFDTELTDAVVVKGKTKPVNVYKVIGRIGAPKSEQLQSWQK